MLILKIHRNARLRHFLSKPFQSSFRRILRNVWEQGSPMDSCYLWSVRTMPKTFLGKRVVPLKVTLQFV